MSTTAERFVTLTTATRDLSAKGSGTQEFRFYSVPGDSGAYGSFVNGDQLNGAEVVQRMGSMGHLAHDRHASAKIRIALDDLVPGIIRKEVEQSIRAYTKKDSTTTYSYGQPSTADSDGWEWITVEGRNTRRDGEFIDEVTLPDGQKIAIGPRGEVRRTRARKPAEEGAAPPVEAAAVTVDQQPPAGEPKTE